MRAPGVSLHHMAFLLDKLEELAGRTRLPVYVVWNLAGRGQEAQAKQHLDEWIQRELAFDNNWLSAQAEAAEAIVLLGDPTHAQRVYERLTPYAFCCPVTSGRANMSYGAVDRHLGGLAAVLGRRGQAIRHLRSAVDRNAALGCAVWQLHSQIALHQLVHRRRAERRVAAAARALGMSVT